MSWTNTIITDPSGFAVTVIPWQNPVWADQAQTRIDVTRHHPVYGDIPFTVDPADKSAGFDTQQLFDAITAADAAGTVSIGAWVDPGPVA